MNYINTELDNVINDSNINVEEKIIIPKKNYYCSNCNKKGHIYKNCNYPVISNGIIAIFIENLNPIQIPLLENYLLDNIKKIRYNIKNNLFINNDFEHNINENIKFLLVQRKNSLGYLEFMRGRYNINNTDLIVRLFLQMTPEEIYDINNKDFDYLWGNLWDSNNIKNKYHHKEYLISKEKFYQLKLQNNNLLENIKPNFDFNEWGFPKGRRELYESDLICAMREFEEETYLKEDDYYLIEKCNSIRENLTGTNGIDYIHNYFLALLNNKTDLNAKINLNNNINREIGNIKIMNIKDCINIIRPYHTNKLCIIKIIYTIINNFIKQYNL
jgi:hypothetical protein